jgi:hypothetical protein
LVVGVHHRWWWWIDVSLVAWRACEQGEWAHPKVTIKEISKFLKTVELPDTWGKSEAHRLLSSSKAKPDVVPALKAHTNHVAVGMGLLTLMAAWPRPTGSRRIPQRRVTAFMKHLQQCHRTITRSPLEQAVSEGGERAKHAHLPISPQAWEFVQTTRDVKS